MIVTSVKGLYPFPANSAYHATKHGLETMADALRLEMLKFDVKVSVVEPGDFSAVTASSSPEHVRVIVIKSRVSYMSTIKARTN